MVNIEISYGTAAKQILLTMKVAEGATARKAVLSSAVKQQFP
ncbi:protein RnfH, partial [Neisseria arctica]